MAEFGDLIQDMKSKGLIHIAEHSVLQADRQFQHIKELANTEPIESDKDWWGVRAYILAHDMARERIPLYDTRITTTRRN